MSECLTYSRYEFEKSQIDAVREVGSRALIIAMDRYGSGFPDFAGGEVRKLGHNNGRHNEKTGDDAARLGGHLGFSEGLQELERTSGRTHDLRQLTGRGSDERESAEWIEKHLRDTGVLPSWATKLAAKAIWGTLPILEDDQIIDQTANLLDFESNEEELFVKCLAAADLGELYTPFGPYSAHMLYGQRQGLRADETPSMDGLLAFQAKQRTLVETYQYPLPEARTVFASHESEVKRYAEYVYGQLERGEIESWEQLIAQDIAFMRDPDGGLTRRGYELIA